MCLSQVCDFSHLQLMTPRELRHELRVQGFEVVHAESLSELSYAGAVYARRLIPSGEAGEVGSGPRSIGGRSAGSSSANNKTFVVARPRTNS